MDSQKSIATDLFYKIRSRFTGLKLGESAGAVTINPESAVFFDFDYIDEDIALGHVSISLAEPTSMKVYFSNGITEQMNIVQKEKWYGFLRELRQFAKRRLLTFDTRDVAKDNLDQRDFAFLSQYNKPQNIGESVMNGNGLYGSKTVSYQKLMDTRLIIKHVNALTDDQQPGARSRNIGALFVENQHGERFKYPFIHLAGARAMQRHVANGGVPYDDLGKSIVGMSEQIAQLKGFGNYVVRNDLLNSDTNSIYERSADALNGLREQIAKLSKQAYYEQYKESFQAPDSFEIPEDVVEDFTEKFTVKNFKEDIKSVFPILYRLMKEESRLGYDDIVAMTGQEQADENIESAQADPFAQFESWAMTLGEASAVQSQDPQERTLAIQKLNELTTQLFPAGESGLNAITSLEGIIEDKELYDAFKAAGVEESNADVRPFIQVWLQQNAPDVLSEVDFGDLASAAGEEQAALATPTEGLDEAKPATGDYEVDGEMGTVYFERDATGNAVVTKVMVGDNDITAIEDLTAIAETIDSEDESPIEDVYILLSVDIDAEYNAAERGSRERGSGMQLEPDYDAYSEITSIVAYGNGNKVNIYTDGLPDSVQDQLQKIADDMHSGDDDYDDYDYDDRYEAIDPKNPRDYERPAIDRRKAGQSPLTMKDVKDKDEKSERDRKSRAGVNVQEVAEFIYSFYDKTTNTFPKSPESVATMTGKKFGPKAEAWARKLAERLAPQQSTQADPRLAEIARIKQLSGMPQQEVPVDEGSAHGYNVVRWYRKNRNSSKITAWLKKEAGLPKETKLYFDDADLVLDSDTIVPEALVDDTLKFNDLLTALMQATGGTPMQSVDGVYRSRETAEGNTPELESIRRLAGM